MKLQRREDWPERLAGFVESRRNAPFVWGVNDCALFVCDAILAMTDVDIAAEFRGKYSGHITAGKVIKRFCGGDLEGLAEKITAENGMDEIPALMAQRGDAVLFDSELGPTLGFVSLNGVSALSVSPDGTTHVLLAQCRRAWRVG